MSPTKSIVYSVIITKLTSRRCHHWNTSLDLIHTWVSTIMFLGILFEILSNVEYIDIGIFILLAILWLQSSKRNYIATLSWWIMETLGRHWCSCNNLFIRILMPQSNVKVFFNWNKPVSVLFKSMYFFFKEGKWVLHTYVD